MRAFALFCLLCSIFVLGLSSASARRKESDEETAQASKDVQTGMAMLQEAGRNPALLAQMMQDMKNPELMAEAQQMMKNPLFVKQMKEMSESKEYKEGMKKTMEALKDPNLAAKTEAKMEHMLKQGNEQLKQAAGGMMEEAMSAMANPEVMAEMSKMMKDPSFKDQLARMTQDPSFKNYIDAMQDMMKDPAKKRRFEEMSAAVRKEL